MTDTLPSDFQPENGYSHGMPDEFESAGAPSDKTLICSTNDCAQQNRQVVLHTDTVLPIHCGGCGSVLHCEHDWVSEKTTMGTLAAPISREIVACTVCLTHLPHVDTALPPMDINDMPVSVIAALLNSPAQ